MLGKYPGVSVAEKRAMLEAAGEEWPVCECHGIGELWKKTTETSAGGFWICREQNREYQREWMRSRRNNPNHRERELERQRKYRRERMQDPDYREQLNSSRRIGNLSSKQRDRIRELDRDRSRRRIHDPSRQEYQRYWMNKRWSERIAMSLCGACGSPLDCESDSRCWSCLEKHKERR